jgi:hypothetical protein
LEAEKERKKREKEAYKNMSKSEKKAYRKEKVKQFFSPYG